MKKCTKCNEVKTLASFHFDPRYTGGYMHQCRKCQSKQGVEWQHERKMAELLAKNLHCSVCGNQITTLRKRLYCSEECQYMRSLTQSKQYYYRIRQTPAYKIHHREYMRNWTRKKRNTKPENYLIKE